MLTIQQPFGQAYAKHIGILVLGLGESGAAMARWCNTQGAAVRVADTRTNLSESLVAHRDRLQKEGVKDFHWGDLQTSLLDGIQLIAMSPGLSPLHEPMAEFLKAAKAQGIPVWSEIEFFAQALAALEREQSYQPKVIAITGTNGKTTTTALTGLLCERAGKTVAVAGNISPAALDKLSTIDELPEVWVLELSSFQLEHTYSLKATAATVLNITQDHLDWHGDMNHYIQAKFKIFGPDTVAVINAEDVHITNYQQQLSDQRIVTFSLQTPTQEDAFGLMHDVAAGGIDWLVWAEPDWEGLEAKVKRRRKKVATDEPLRMKRLMPADALRIRGRHNCANALAALALCTSVGLPMSPLLHGLREYQGEPHRVQSVAIVEGVEYVDDSKGTNVGATLAAMTGLGSQGGRQHIILIAGGDGKGQDFSPLQSVVAAYAKAVLLIGKDGPTIEKAILSAGVKITHPVDLQAAVVQASELSESGDIVLLSPACASFDMFKDYAHRAEVFISAVNDLALSQGQVGA